MIDLRVIMLFAALASASGAAAQTACELPAPPAKIDFEALAKPKPPEKPACAERNRCTGADVDRYNTAIGKFNAALFNYDETERGREKRLNTYIAALNLFQTQTEAYASCERARLIAVLDAER